MQPLRFWLGTHIRDTDPGAAFLQPNPLLSNSDEVFRSNLHLAADVR